MLAPTSVGEAKAKTQSAEVLTRARGMLQREMGKGLATRTIPRLEFVFDEGVGGAVRVNRLLADLAKDRPPQPQPPVDEPPAN